MRFGQRMSISAPKDVQKNFTLIKVYGLCPSLLKVKWLTSWLWHTIELAKLWLQGDWLRSSQELLHWITLRTFYWNDVLRNVCNCWNKEALSSMFPPFTKFVLKLCRKWYRVKQTHQILCTLFLSFYPLVTPISQSINHIPVLPSRTYQQILSNASVTTAICESTSDKSPKKDRFSF